MVMTRTSKIIVHAGFHKTGTKSVQSVLEDNRALLAPHMRCFVRPDVRKMITFARRFSQSGDGADLNGFGRRCRMFFERLDASDPRPVVISAEDLAGYMPGRNDVKTYAAVPKLMAELELALATVFNEGFDLDILLSTRARDGWLKSLWWQNLRSRRLTLDLARHSAAFQEAADLQAIVEQTQIAVLQGTVHAAALEITKSAPQGPTTPLLDLAGVDDETRAQMTQAGIQNSRPQNGIEDIFLALNRSSFSDNTVSETKKALLHDARDQET